MTTFATILGDAVAATPGARGATFAAGDGELVDGATTGDPHDWALLTAHYGVILASLESLLGTKHFGGAQYFVVASAATDVVVHTVEGGYFALMALTPPAALARALGNLARAAERLRLEMA